MIGDFVFSWAAVSPLARPSLRAIGSLSYVRGKFYAAAVFEDLPEDEVEEFNQQFPPMEKLRLPGQWGYEELPNS